MRHGVKIIIMRAIVFTVVWLVLGCSLLPQDKLYEDYAVGPLKYDTQTSPYNRIMTNILQVKMPDNTTNVVPQNCVDGSVLRDDAIGICTRARALVTGDLIGVSNEICAEHMKTIFGNEASFNIVTGTFTNAFSGAATVVGGVTTKAALAAAAAFSNAERSLVNETVYKSVLVPAVTKKIRESRQEQFNVIKENLKQDINTYPISSAVFDVIAYHQNCSFMIGLQRALDEGTQDKTNADIGELTQKLSLINLQIEQRKNEIRKNYQDVKNEDDMNKKFTEDPQYKALQARYEAVSNTLKTLEAKTSSTK